MRFRRLLQWMAGMAGAGLAAVSGAENFVRWNQAGYPPDRAKELVVMAEKDLAGQRWSVTQGPRVVLEGRFEPSSVGSGMHTPLPFNHRVDVSPLVEPGEYVFTAPGAEPAVLRVDPSPYARFLPQALQHLRMVRSGSDEVPGRRRSHDGDARAPVYVPDGDPAEGRWRPTVPARTVDVRGGWYDAGDQIKFTLNEAYTVYVMLLSYQLQPALFDDPRGGEPAILAEARHGLEYLARLYPDPDTFVIQVGDETDHNQPLRLPEDDALDGRRPAFTALSRVHLASTAAALAKGAQVWAGRGD
jgi:endoglucanase